MTNSSTLIPSRLASAIIGAMTALGILTTGISNSLSQLGSETFTVKKFPSIQMGGMAWLKYIHRKTITYDQIRFVRSNTRLPIAVSADVLPCNAIAGRG